MSPSLHLNTGMQNASCFLILARSYKNGSGRWTSRTPGRSESCPSRWKPQKGPWTSGEVYKELEGSQECENVQLDLHWSWS